MATSNSAFTAYAEAPVASSGVRNTKKFVCELACRAVDALVTEVELTPKPGLVDRANCGAHTDMSLETFYASAHALKPYFERYVMAGFERASAFMLVPQSKFMRKADAPAPGSCASSACRPHDAFASVTPARDTVTPDAPARNTTATDQKFIPQLAEELRRIGQEAEAAMLAATGGVNTHKGANFSLALILGAAGALLAQGAPLPFSPNTTETLLDLVARLAAHLAGIDLAHVAATATASSHGEAIYLIHGITGIRGEASRGYPVLQQVLLPYLRHASALRGDDQTFSRGHRGGMSPDASRDAILLAGLLLVMGELEDTNIIHRGGTIALAEHHRACHAIAARATTPEALIIELERYDHELIAKNLSPGGAADILALGIFLISLESR